MDNSKTFEGVHPGEIRTSPLVSILMTAYNRGNFIAEAIESVMASSYTNWELIICDDCSKDGTVEIASKYAKQDRRIKIFKNTVNLGDYPNRNKAASHASGQYIMYVDSDDTILADGIENCMNIMAQYQDACFGMRLFADNVSVHKLDSSTIINQHFFGTPLLTMGPGGTIIKKKFFHEIGGYPEKYGPANDMYFNLKAACRSSIVMIPFEFLFYRRHEGQQINNKQSYLYNNYLYLKDALDELPLGLAPEKIAWLHAKNKRRFLLNVAKDFAATFNLKKSIHFFRIVKFSLRDVVQAIFH